MRALTVALAILVLPGCRDARMWRIDGGHVLRVDHTGLLASTDDDRIDVPWCSVTEVRLEPRRLTVELVPGAQAVIAGAWEDWRVAPDRLELPLDGYSALWSLRELQDLHRRGVASRWCQP